MERIQKILRGRFVLGALSIAVVLAAYQWITMQPDNNPALLPPIPNIIASFFTNIEAGSLQTTLGASLYRIFLGFFIGTTLAVIIGCLVGWYKTIEYLVDPLIEAIRPIPPLAYIPIIIIWFGIEEFSRVLLITIACFMVCVVNVIAGMKNVPQVYVDAASTMGASRFQVFRTVAVPAATPFIITGYRIALAAAWTTLVAAELIAAPSGLGYMLQEGRRYFLTDQVMMIIVIIGACAFIMDRTFRAIQKRLMVWSEARE
ncbi:Alkanesulfonates transport system permease protein [Candidatus Rhodobacter oscarellae]|uniref:Alkanesulfonates transport system permease protein n=1 Tax=Candidatus Rhodobacter oscarellae TaxID=1675527 RepID=A0A0J9GZC8_9RHOB|nr:ABC transporter permease [Candidatus Rhodobacter lobularis]KMW58833.1 Alkanesulfonates transport system permease protein [Candidatus Rhodobacter lobularis]